jgi:hypothetical protein
MRANYYIIDGINERFDTLGDAKYHIWFAYTPNERIKYFGDDCSYICGINARTEELVSLTLIKISETGDETFGRTIKIK